MVARGPEPQLLSFCLMGMVIFSRAGSPQNWGQSFLDRKNVHYFTLQTSRQCAAKEWVWSLLFAGLSELCSFPRFWVIYSFFERVSPLFPQIYLFPLDSLSKALAKSSYWLLYTNCFFDISKSIWSLKYNLGKVKLFTNSSLFPTFS